MVGHYPITMLETVFDCLFSFLELILICDHVCILLLLFYVYYCNSLCTDCKAKFAMISSVEGLISGIQQLIKQINAVLIRYLCTWPRVA